MPKSQFLKKENLISWKFVHAIPDRTIQKNVKLNVSNQDLKGMHPADLADILEDLDIHGRQLIFEKLDPETAARTLSEVEQDIQALLIDPTDPTRVAQIIENMGTDEAADFLSELKRDQADKIIAAISDDEIQEEIQELLDYEEYTAGGIMSTEVFEVKKDYSKEKILELIEEDDDDIETIYDLYVVDDEYKLIGSCSLRKVLSTKNFSQISEIMQENDLKKLPPNTHWKELAEFMSKYNLINVPITDENNELLGVVSVDDVLPWLLEERS